MILDIAYFFLESIFSFLASFLFFFFNPNVITANVAISVVLADLLRQHGPRYALRVGVAMEIAFFLIWSVIPGSLTAAVYVIAVVCLRETLVTGPHYEVLEGATFYSGMTSRKFPSILGCKRKHFA